MGITGELVKSVFSKTRSTKTQESNVRYSGTDKNRWTSVRAYLCGDEFSSVLADEDSASIKSSEATVTQPIQDYSQDTEEGQSKETRYDQEEEQDHSSIPLHEEVAAAIVIQSAFRGLMVRRQMNAVKFKAYREELLINKESPSRESMATSIEVQTTNSAISIPQELTPNRQQHKTKAQVFKPKEEWDDSTVGSSVSRMRTHNRLEAMTRRERALAYAFSQQLRICSKKRQTKCDETEANMGSTWLERWMATRLPESYSVEDSMSGQLETDTIRNKPIMKNRILDISFDGKESCGSNEVPVFNDGLGITTQRDKYDCKESAKNKIPGTKKASRKAIPPYNHTKAQPKISKKDVSKEAKNDKRYNIKQVGDHTDALHTNKSSQTSTETIAAQNLQTVH